MSLNVIKKPKILHPIFSDDNDFIFYDSDASGGIEWIYTDTIIKSTSVISSVQSNVNNINYEVLITIGGETSTIKVHADLKGIGVFNPRYVLENYIESKLVNNKSLIGELSNGIVTYDISVRYYKDSTLVSTASIGTFKCYNGTSQGYDVLDITDYISTIGKTAQWLNKYKGDLYVNINDTLTLQAFIGTSGLESNGFERLTSISLVEYYKDVNDGIIKSRTATKNLNISNDTLAITNINISPSFWGIGSDILYYDVHTSNNLFDVVRVHITQPNMLVNRRYRFKYINSNGATDYFNFNAADSEQRKIKKREYTHNNKKSIYKTESSDTIDVISSYMSELTSFDLSDIWDSPKVSIEVIDNKTNTKLHEYDAIINNNSVDIQREYELISYKVSFGYITERNIQR